MWRKRKEEKTMMEIVEKADEGNGKEVENRRKRRIKNRKEDEGMDEAILVLASVITKKKRKRIKRNKTMIEFREESSENKCRAVYNKTLKILKIILYTISRSNITPRKSYLLLTLNFQVKSEKQIRLKDTTVC